MKPNLLYLYIVFRDRADFLAYFLFYSIKVIVFRYEIMWIDKIEEYNKKRLVYGEGTILFACYPKELSVFEIEEGMEWSEEQYLQLKQNVLLPRAKKRVLYLLQRKMYSEVELWEKLKQEYYPIEVIEETIQYVKQFHYIDDERLAEQYIRSKMGQKSQRVLKQQLKQKGISDFVIEQTFGKIQESFYQDKVEETESLELEAIRKYVRKKGVSFRNKNDEERDDVSWDYTEIQKLTASLLRKGFQIENIKKVLANCTNHIE